MADKPKPPAAPIGEPFSRVYIERGAPTQDSTYFRNRLPAYLLAEHAKDYAALASYLQREGGFVVPTSWVASSVFYDFPKFFAESPIAHVLSAVTFIWRYLQKYSEWKQDPDKPQLLIPNFKEGKFVYPKSEAWHAFVSRALREENMAYALDEKCGVHFFVDEEFERNRLSTLKCLGLPRYSGVAAAFEAAHKKLEQLPPDSKGAIRDTFEAVETLTKLISGSGKALDTKFVNAEIGPSLQRLHARDAVAQRASGKAAQSFADWIDAAHTYRHGHEAEEPIAPPLDLAALLVSQGASFIRWLVDLDMQLTGGGLV